MSILVGQIAERVGDILSKICMEYEVHIISGKVYADHVYMFVSYKSHLAVSKLVLHLKGTILRILFQEFSNLLKKFLG